MVLGGYGNFGKRIVSALVAKGIEVQIVGRNLENATKLANELGGEFATPLCFDVSCDLADALRMHKPLVLVNTVGPFQAQGYEVARIAIANRVHYIDLADGREFVCSISELDSDAIDAGVSIISGASTVPALSDAVVSEFAGEFASIDLMKYGISRGRARNVVWLRRKVF